MRKIDVVLLSALILYDYSAQTLVDRDVIDLGSSFITEHNNFQEDKLAEPSLLPDSYNATLTSKKAEQLNPYGLDADATAAKNISQKSILQRQLQHRNQRILIISLFISVRLILL